MVLFIYGVRKPFLNKRTMNKNLLLALLAIFGVAQMTWAEKPVDVSEMYLQNYKLPYQGVADEALVSGTVAVDGTDVNRFQKLGAPWVVTNGTGDWGTDRTEWYVDMQKKGGALTLTVGWDGMAATIENVKVSQSVTLPAGKYDLSLARAQDWSGASSTFMVVSLGEIPNIEADSASLKADALAYSRLDDATKVSFTLETEKTLNIGLVATFVEEQISSTIGNWRLVQWQEGSNYENLKTLATEASAVTQDQYPVGTAVGEYNEPKRDKFFETLALINEFIQKDENADGVADENATQEEVDAQYNMLRTAWDELEASRVPAARPEFSTDAKTIWYYLKDNRSTSNYLYVGDDGTNGIEARLLYRKELQKVDAEMFKFVRKAEGSEELYIYSKYDESTTVAVDPSTENVIRIMENTENDTWLLEDAKDPIAFVLKAVNQEGNNMLNSFADMSEGIIGFWNDEGKKGDAGSQWLFVNTDGTGVKTVSAIDLGVYVQNRTIVAKDLSAKLNVYNANGQQVNAKTELTPGLYLVQVEGKVGTVKLLVK